MGTARGLVGQQINQNLKTCGIATQPAATVTPEASVIEKPLVQPPSIKTDYIRYLTIYALPWYHVSKFFIVCDFSCIQILHKKIANPIIKSSASEFFSVSTLKLYQNGALKRLQV